MPLRLRCEPERHKVLQSKNRIVSNVAWVGLAGAVGLLIGSFVTLLADRLPLREPVLLGRSRCLQCGTVLRAHDLVPLLSFLWLGGRCRYCRASISADLPLVEAAAAAIGILAFLIAPGWWALATAVFGWTLLLIALLDFRHFWMPVWLNLFLAAAGLSVSCVQGRIVEAAAGALAGFVSLEAIRLIYRWRTGREGLGGGDPLLFGALGAWLGAAALPSVLLLAAMGALIFIAMMAALHRSPLERNARVPLGAWLAAAGFIIWCAGRP